MISIQNPFTRSGNGRTLLFIGAAALIIFALVPYGWVAERVSIVHKLAFGIFATETAHIIGHAALFAGIGAALLLVFPILQRYPRGYLSIIVVIGVLQEWLQLRTFKHRPFGAPELYDLFVDLAGAALIYLLLWRQPGE